MGKKLNDTKIYTTVCRALIKVAFVFYTIFLLLCSLGGIEFIIQFFFFVAFVYCGNVYENNTRD